MRNASGQQGENERQWKKKKGAGTCDEEDSRCNNNGKEISKKRVLHLQSCWFVFAN